MRCSGTMAGVGFEFRRVSATRLPPSDMAGPREVSSRLYPAARAMYFAEGEAWPRFSSNRRGRCAMTALAWVKVVSGGAAQRTPAHASHTKREGDIEIFIRTWALHGWKWAGP